MFWKRSTVACKGGEYQNVSNKYDAMFCLGKLATYLLEPDLSTWYDNKQMQWITKMLSALATKD